MPSLLADIRSSLGVSVARIQSARPKVKRPSYRIPTTTLLTQIALVSFMIFRIRLLSNVTEASVKKKFQ